MNKPNTTMQMNQIDERMIDDADQLKSLDELLGLMPYDEIYEAWDLPVVEAVQTDSSDPTRWLIVSAARTPNHYEVRGIALGPTSGDGFDARLSLDGRVITVSGGVEPWKPPVRLVHKRNISLTRELGRFRGDVYLPVSPYDDAGVPLARNVARRIADGISLGDAIEAESHGDSVQAYGIWRALRGWWRSHRWHQIADEHRDEAAAAQVPLIEYAPAREAAEEVTGQIAEEEARRLRSMRSEPNSPRHAIASRPRRVK